MSYRRAILVATVVTGPYALADFRSTVSIDGGRLADPVATVWTTPQTLHPAMFGHAPTVVDRSLNTFVSVNGEPDADLPTDVVFAPDGVTALIVHYATDNVTFLDTATRTVADTVTVGGFPVFVAVSPDGQKAVTANVLGNSVTVIDMVTRTALGEVLVTGTQPYRVAITSDSRYAVVGIINDAIDSAMCVVDLQTLTEVRWWFTPSQGAIGFHGDTESGISGPLFTKFALAPDDSLVVLPNRNVSDVRLYDWTSGAQVAVVPTAGQPTAVDISSDSSTAIISHEGTHRRISKIDLPSRTRTGDFAVAADLWNQVIRITPDRSHAIAGLINSVIFVNLNTGATATEIATGTPGDIEISHDGQFAFVSNFNARVINIATRTLVSTMPFAACVEAAVSPTTLRAVALNNRFREDVNVFGINGASSSVQGLALSGGLPEADAPRVVAITPDGQTVIVNNNVSRNVAFVDLNTQTVMGYVDTGDRPQGSAVTPDGQYALIANTDTNTVSVIEMATRTRVANLPISTRPVHIRISPDSQTAYVLSVAGTDMIHFIRIAGAASNVLGTALSGQTGSAFGFAFTEVSGIELSADGSLLAVCASFDDNLRLIDTATRNIVANVPTGDFPIRVAFSADGTRAYVANAFSNDMTVVNVNGGASSAIATVALNGRPLTINPDSDSAFVYVGVNSANFGQNTGGVRVFDALTNNVVHSVNFDSDNGPRDAALVEIDDILYVASGDGEWITIDAAGASSAIIDRVSMTSTPSDMVYSVPLRRAIAALPIPDGIDIFAEILECPGDVDGNGVVDLVDLAFLLTHFGTASGATNAQGDVDGDRDVDLNDLARLLINFGNSCR
ncbi:MAG: hypothetical protein ACKVS9_04570 [Phycisphaerae bacterium]